MREEEGVSVLEACQILSRNAHRNTSQWEYVHKHVFKNGRLEETHEYVLSHYEKPDEMFEDQVPDLRGSCYGKGLRNGRNRRMHLLLFTKKTKTTKAFRSQQGFQQR